MKQMYLMALASLFSVYAVAQGIEIDVDKDEGGWWGNPIVWVIGAAVFILLLVALLRRK
jgi:hypothetical protein